MKDLFGNENTGARPREKLSDDRARTIRNKALIERGVHPFGAKLRQPPGETCGSCKHSCSVKLSKTYWKCALTPTQTKGPGTDLRLSWPACERWEAA